MTWDVATARVRQGLVATDASQDPALNGAMSAAITIAENYCDRIFMSGHQIETFVDTTTSHFQLKRFPLQKINSITGGGKYDADMQAGWFNTHSAYRRSFSVDYDGGYVTLPTDLELALWQIFDSAYGLSASAGGGVSGGIKKVAVTGVGSIDYDTGASAATTSSALIPAAAINILDTYKLERA